MSKSVQLFSDSLIGIKIGSVSSGVIDTVKVNCYGQPTPIKHLAQTGKNQNSVFIDPYDPSIITNILGALKDNGFSAYQFSKTRVLVNVPVICGEEKDRIAKHLAKLAEDARIAIRNLRKTYRQKIEKEELKEKEKQIQSLTDSYISEIDSILARKVKEL